MIGIIPVALAAVPLGSGLPCMKARVDIPADQRVEVPDFEPVDCPRQVRPALRYKSNRKATYTILRLRQGDVVRKWPDAAPNSAMPGDRLIMRVVIGHVAVERGVIALQPGRQGKKLFVQDEQGKVLSVPLMGPK